jgi:hypothetical protein
LTETDGQLLYEWKHLKRKLKRRAPKVLATHKEISTPEAHPIFKIVSGQVQEWEVINRAVSKAAEGRRNPKPVGTSHAP